VHVNDLLKFAVESGASDLHLKVGGVPMMRVGGALVAVPDATRLGREDVVAASTAIMSPAQHQKFEDEQEMDFSAAPSGWCSGWSRLRSRASTSLACPPS
jgi:twitching motility protein PilT